MLVVSGKTEKYQVTNGDSIFFFFFFFLSLHAQTSLPLSVTSLLLPLTLSLHHSPYQPLPSRFLSREAWPHLGAMITQGRVINGCRVSREISNGQAVSQRKCSSVCPLPRGPMKVSLADFSQAWPFAWGSRGNGVSANQLTEPNPEIHKHHTEEEEVSDIHIVACWAVSSVDFCPLRHCVYLLPVQEAIFARSKFHVPSVGGMYLKFGASDSPCLQSFFLLPVHLRALQTDMCPPAWHMARPGASLTSSYYFIFGMFSHSNPCVRPQTLVKAEAKMVVMVKNWKIDLHDSN